MTTQPLPNQNVASSETPSRLPNRWIIALCGVLIQMMLGTVYAWSVFKIPLKQAHGWSEYMVGITFALTIFFLGFSAALGGRLVDKAGSRKVATIGGVLFGIGTLIAALAHQIDSIYLLWLGYGVIGGIGNGLAYVTPIAVLTRWFPDKKGFITGLAVMGFGLGAAFMSVIAPAVIKAYSGSDSPGVSYVLYASGAIFLVGLPLAAKWLVNPPAGYTVAAAPGKVATAPKVSLTLAEARTKPQLYILWGILFFNVAAGIALIANLSNMAQENIKISAILAASIVTAGSFCNGIGRVFWGTLSEKLGRRNVFLLIFLTQIPLFLLLPHISSFWPFTLMACWILLCYGGGFGTMPSFTADTFGAKNMGAIYGVILFAWGVAGGVGPMLMEFFKNATKTAQNPNGSFDIALYIAAGLLTAGLILTLLYRKPKST
jgi:OFA family oxalate/formate antiporter-like MFS transporter